MSKSLLHGVILTCLFSGVLLANESNAQHKSINEVFISLELRQVTVGETLQQIQERTEFKFIYEQDVLSATREHRVTLEVANESVAEVLKIISGDTRLSFRQLNGSIVVKAPTPAKEVDTPKENLPALPAKVVSGKVTDSEGEPLAGVNVYIKATNRGTVTDIDGNYRLDAEEVDVLVFSYIGYSVFETTVGTRTVIDVLLQEDLTNLKEVVVNAGYWEVKERENTGNIAKVTAQEIEAQPVTTPLQALSGRVAGVVIRQRSGVPGGGIDIQIRGQNSLRLDGNNPLYIVDGVPYPSSPVSSPDVVGGIFGSEIDPINYINPSDIESIEILKDADATAIYGSRGANGVVLITTRKGQSGKTTVDVNHYSGIGEVSNRLDLLNTEQYREMVFESLANDGIDPIPDFFKPLLHDLFAWDSTRNTDWQEKLIGGTANYQNTQFSISGGNPNTQFLFSGTYFRQTTVFPGDFALQRGSGHFNLNHRSTDQKFTANLSLSYVAEKNNLPRQDFTLGAISTAPHAPEVFDEEGNLNFENNTFTNNPFTDLFQRYEGKTRNLISNMTLGYQIVSDLMVKANLGYNNITVNENNISPIKSKNPTTNPTGSTLFGNGSTETWIIEPQIEYRKNIGMSQLTVLIGSTFQGTLAERESVFASGYTSDALIENINAAPNVDIQDATFSEYRYNAFFGRINYNWNGKYILNITGRRDGSSRFSPGRQFANFGAVGAAWIFSEEPFIKNNLPFISFGKLRTSYGTTGSDQVGNYEFLDTHKPTNLPYLGTTGLIPSRLANPNFGWESNKKIEGGIELGLINDRIFLTASYYRNRSSNQLTGIPLAGTTGFSTLQSNFPATVENRGWEFVLNTSNISTGDFKWSTSFNVTIPRNELIEFPNIENSSFANIYTVGESLFNRKRFNYTGVDPETGFYTFEDVNEDGQLDEDDLQSVKEIAPSYFGGVQNKISFKGIELGFFFQFVKQTGINYLASFPQPGFRTNYPIQILDRWQQPGDITEIQRFAILSSEASQAYENSLRGTNIISDASFIRLQNVSLAYNFPTAITENLKLQNLRVYVQGQNLLTITDYIGLDPETQSSQALPPLRVVTAGIQVKF